MSKRPFGSLALPKTKAQAKRAIMRFVDEECAMNENAPSAPKAALKPPTSEYAKARSRADDRSNAAPTIDVTKLYVVLKGGALVREGADLETPYAGTIASGEVVRVVEETVLEGESRRPTKRARLESPVAGWASLKALRRATAQEAKRAAQKAEAARRAAAAAEAKAIEAPWAHVRERLGWTYLHEPPSKFTHVFLKEENYHHLLAYLETVDWDDLKKSVSAKTLNKLHGQPRRCLGISHHVAKEFLNNYRTRVPERWRSKCLDLASYAILDELESS